MVAERDIGLRKTTVHVGLLAPGVPCTHTRQEARLMFLHRKNTGNHNNGISPMTMHLLTLLILVVCITTGVATFLFLTAVCCIKKELAVNAVFGFTSLGLLLDAIFFLICKKRINQSSRRGKAYVSVKLLVGTPAELFMAIFGAYLILSNFK